MAQLDPNIPLSILEQGQRFDPVGSFLEGRTARQQGQAARETSTLRAEQIANLRSQVDLRESEDIRATQKARDDRRARSIIQGLAVVDQLMKEDPSGQKAIDFLDVRIPKLEADPNQDAVESIDLRQQLAAGLQSGNQSAAKATILSGQALANQLDIPFAVGEVPEEFTLGPGDVRFRGSTAIAAVPAVDPEGKITSAQREAATFAQRLSDANTVISDIGSQFTGLGSRVGGVVMQGLKSQDRQRFEQATRNFLNAILRKESGAAIAASEFESGEQQYFPQPGDKEDVLEQKGRNRDVVMAGLIAEAGEAFEEIQSLLPSSFVMIRGKKVLVGAILTNDGGDRARANADGTITRLP